MIPWAKLLALIEPHYPKAGNGRQPLGWRRISRRSRTRARYEHPFHVVKRLWGFAKVRYRDPEESGSCLRAVRARQSLPGAGWRKRN